MDIPPDHVVPELRATERYSAIREFLQYLVGVGAVPRHAEESMLRAFYQREEIMTTGVGFGVAIPHISSDVVAERVLALGRSKTGVEFASIDGRPARTVLLMISPKQSKTIPDS